MNGKKLIIGEAFSGLTILQFSKAYHTITKKDALAIICNYTIEEGSSDENKMIFKILKVFVLFGNEV